MPFAGSRARRYTVVSFGVVAALLLIVLFFPWNLLRGPIASIVSSRLQRPVTIGHVAVRWGAPTDIQLDDVAIGNAAWSTIQPMASFPSMILSFRLPSLLRMTPDTVRLVRPDVVLERNAAGDANWRFDDAPGHTGAAFGAIFVDRGTVRYRDKLLPASIDATLQTDATPAQALQFAGRGTLRGDPLQIDGTSAAIAELRQVNAPYRLMLRARAGTTTMAFDGTAIPSELENVQGSLRLTGPDLSKLYPIVPSPLPWTPPYDLTGDLRHANQQWIFRGIKGTVGDSDLAGDFTVDVSGKRHLTTADLTSRKLNYQDLGGFIGLPPGDPAHTQRTPEQRRAEEQRVASGRVLPNRPFNLTHLRDHDVDVRFKGTNVKWAAIPFDQVVTHIVLKDGVMRLEPLDFGIADGHVVSNITLDATRDVPTAQAKIDARNVELKRIFPQLASPNGSAGRFGGRAQLRAKGGSVGEMFATADGEAAVAMRGGEASTFRLVLTNIDLARAAQLLIGGDETAAIHCGVAALHVKNGLMTPDLFVVDTSAELIMGTGSVNFADEKYDLHLKASSKTPSILALKGPIVIGGTFKTPTVRPEMAPLMARIGASVGLGVVAGPLALLPLIDLGDAKDADCKALYQDARVETGTTERIARSTKPAKTGKAVVKRAAN
jgi:uncharacterized protein involved in outer membrane biogenesis